MLVRNVEPRLIRVGGEFIAPNQEIEVAENATGLASLLKRGTLIQVDTDTNSEAPETKSEKSNKGKK
ncbi:hypothetical protein ACLSY0_00170 [Avibacterium avium]|uniref:hypothetical protein n=1 Tax=Avibacterium avium TaxID=751 RepID=UPI003BF77958